jgi:hypothetical protein
MGVEMRHLSLGLVALISLFAVPAEAAKLSQGSLTGRWCGDGVNYSFSRSALSVSRKGAKNETIKIKGFAVTDTEVQVFYADPYGGGSRFGEFSADGRSMVQQGSAFGSMPRRAFKRC